MPLPPEVPSSAGASASGPAVKAGFFRQATEEDGTPVAAIAAVQEFGAVVRGQGAHAVVIPPRPFLRQSLAENRTAWVRLLAQALKTSLRNGIKVSGAGGATTGPLRMGATPLASQRSPSQASSLDRSLASSLPALIQQLRNPTQALSTVGRAMQADITHTIRQIRTPPNAPATIRHKGFDKPLEETGMLEKNVAFQVVS
ncbi:hypothetical protein OQ252_12215 [Acetobacter farinalis]|uniref:Uncharacterized protein n=1 Tax=Acetobacter farinalis TaxID=1260984 RepID=A0ABT3QA63_9PROT|nr:hypothetical protein [Acetobacter farinalis]MCX2562155.1 hypothetical protein [Acetobacter farinalis]NHO30707.1 hypothetical protein [Acetobacter farinalis]